MFPSEKAFNLKSTEPKQPQTSIPRTSNFTPQTQTSSLNFSILSSLQNQLAAKSYHMHKAFDTSTSLSVLPPYNLPPFFLNSIVLLPTALSSYAFTTTNPDNLLLG